MDHHCRILPRHASATQEFLFQNKYGISFRLSENSGCCSERRVYVFLGNPTWEICPWSRRLSLAEVLPEFLWDSHQTRKAWVIYNAEVCTEKGPFQSNFALDAEDSPWLRCCPVCGRCSVQQWKCFGEISLSLYGALAGVAFYGEL